MNKIFTKGLLLGSLALAMMTQTTYAGHDDEQYYRSDRDNSDVQYYRAQTSYVYADVVNVEPIRRYVTVSRPERVCQQVEYRHNRNDRYDRHGRHESAGGTIAGGLIGGVIGRQIGGGKGRDAATIAGVLIGSAIGHDSEVNKNRQRDDRHYESGTREQCQTRYERHEEERIDGYRVTYFFQGEKFTTQTRYKPDSKIRLAITARPVESEYGAQNNSSQNREYDRYEEYDYRD